jgi:alcohol dehydrogenase
VRETDVEILAATLGDACLSTNPRDADATDIPALFRAAL